MKELKSKREQLETKDSMDEKEVTQLKSEIDTLEEKISKAIETEQKRADDMEAKLNSPEFAERKNDTKEDVEVKAYRDYLVGGVIDTKALNSTDGAALIPHKLMIDMDSTLADEVFIEKNGTIIPNVEGVLDVASIETDDDADYRDDGDAADGSQPTDIFPKLSYTPQLLSRMIKVSDQLVKNSAGNVEKLVQGRYIENIAEVKEKNYINGDGTKGPLGIFKTPEVETIYTGAGALDEDVADDIQDLIHNLKARFRKDAAFIMSRETKGKLAKIKDTNGYYVFKELRNAEPTIEGFPVHESEYAPEDNIAFYSQKRYRIVKGKGLSVKVFDQTYAANNQIGYRFNEYNDGGMSRTDAVAVLVIGEEPTAE